MKTCIDCGTEYRPTGKGSRCLPCRRVWDAAWRVRRSAQGRPVVSTKMPRSYHVDYNETYYQRDDVRRRRAEAAEKRRLDASEAPKIAARAAVRNALRRGELTKSPCERCGSTRVDAHHDDYSQPLNVKWVCRTHHIELHAKAEGR